MQNKTYEQLNEEIFTVTLENGLKVILHPKPDFHKTYALFSTDFGSIDQQFIPLGKEEVTRMPDGIAHFLEHKMFEKEDGDVFHTFSKYGASANAFTSFTKTAYLFSSTSAVKENLETLLNFVQEPYFTEDTVNKEKGIISQEIQMYDDHPEWRLLFGLLKNLFPNHPVNIDIAGTVDSINEITAEMLYENYHTFYHPSNMQLFITGQIDPTETLNWIKENQQKKTFAPPAEIIREFPENTGEVKPINSIQMDINRPKVALGIRGTGQQPKGKEALKFVLSMEMLLKCLFGETSSNYLTLYDEGLIDDSFGFEFTFDRTFDFLTVNGETKDPEAFIAAIENILLTAEDSPELNQEHFATVKKRSIGQALQALNSLEYIAHRFNDSVYGEANVFDMVPIMEDITLNDIRQQAADYMKKENFSVFKVLPN